MQPRSLIRIKPQTTLFGLDAARQFIDRDNWQIAKGELKTTGISNKSVEPKYRSGDRSLVLHLFGGIGGERAESLGIPQTISIIIFVIYHPLNAKIFYKAGDPTFFNPIFLLLAGLLGLTCAIAYALTGSLLIITTIHWLVVVIWIFGCGGMGRLTKS